MPLGGIEPGVSALAHPAPRLLTSDFGLFLLTARDDVGGAASLSGHLAHLVIVKAGIQTQPRLGQGSFQVRLPLRVPNPRQFHLQVHLDRAKEESSRLAAMIAGSLSSVSRTSFLSWRLAPSTTNPTTIPAASVSGLLFPPPRGAFVMAPSRAIHSKFKPCLSSYSSRLASHNRAKKPASIHS